MGSIYYACDGSGVFGISSPSKDELNYIFRLVWDVANSSGYSIRVVDTNLTLPDFGTFVYYYVCFKLEIVP